MKKRYRYIMGKNCIREVLKAFPERLVQVYTSSNDELKTEIIQTGIPVLNRSKQALSQMVQSESHQSYVAEIKEHNQLDLKSFLKREKEKSLVVMLDSIFDPQNFGAILRASECFGVDCVVYSKNRGTDVTPVVSKVSMGASELVPLLRVSNLAETMKQFQQAGFWAVVADAGEKSQSLFEFSFPEKTLLILGSEGSGVQKILRDKADFHLKIPMLGQIDSLNVSQAAAVFLSYHQ